MTEPAVPPTGDGGLVRVRLDLSYDGTDFAGWAVQPGQRTVQAEVEGALAIVLRLPRVRTTCAGRTDAGVHARGQVTHVDLPTVAWDGDERALGRRLAGVLPRDVAVRAVQRAPDGFDARFSPLWRRYAYRISEHPFGPDPLRRRDVLSHGR
ncbi:MAG: tRNA pseudouridine synthase A, partial [Sporichthyaceae bacterium]